MRRKALTLALILAILLSVTIGKQVAKLGIANPWTEFRWTEPPVISMQSPTNETNSRSILLNFTVTKPEGWKSNPTMYLGTPIRYGEVQQFDSVKIEIDGETYRSIEVHSDLSSPFSYSENLANLDDGLHSLRVYAYSKGVVEGCEWSPNTLIENYSLSDLVYFRLDTTAPVISVLSIENKTYYSPDVPLDFTLNEPVSQIEYSLDGNENISISGNTTLTELANRDHTLIIYARDSVGNLGKSKTIVFTIAEEPESEPFPTPLVVASIVTVTVIALGLLLYFKKTQALSRICLFTFTF